MIVSICGHLVWTLTQKPHLNPPRTSSFRGLCSSFASFVCRCVANVQILPIDFGEPASGDEWASEGVAHEPDLSIFGSDSKEERPPEAYNPGAGVDEAEVRERLAAEKYK